MAGFRIRFRVEIAPEDEADGATGAGDGISTVDEEAVRTVSAAQAVSIDDMEEALLENVYEVMRRALGEHFARVSKRGLSGTPGQGS
jgi:hypothetical protein